MNLHFFTIASFNYLAQIAILKESIEATHPEVPFTVFLCDELYGEIPAPLQGARIVPISQLGLKQFKAMAHRYSILELNTAVKPFVFAYVFDAFSADFAIYLDPDMLAVSRFEECIALAESRSADIILTPHTSSPVEDDCQPNDFDMAKAGIYNLGFCGVAASGVGRDFVGWWARKLLEHCRVDIANGIFVDQKWCDAVPALFKNVHILQHDGYNVGYWNLVHRPLWTCADGTLMAGNDVARLLHFSGMDMQQWKSVSKHQNRLTLANINRETRDAFSAYRFQLLANGFFNLTDKAATLPITKLFLSSDLNAQYSRAFERLTLRTGAKRRFPSTADFESYLLSEEMQDGATYKLPDFLLTVWEMRADVAAAYPDLISSAGVLAYLRWCRNGIKETPLLNEPAATLMIEGHIQTLAFLSGAPRADNNRSIIFELFETTSDQHEIYPVVANLLGDFVRGSMLEDAPIPAVLRAIYARRPDLSEKWALNRLPDRAALVEWAAGRLEIEFGPQPALRPMLDAMRQDPINWAAAWRGKQTCPGGTDGSEPPATINWPRAINHGLRSSRDYAIYQQRPGPGRVTAEDDTGVSLINLPPLQDHVSLIGYSRAQSGMGEHVRNTADALASAGVRFDVLNFDFGVRSGRDCHDLDAKLVAIPRGKVNVFHINADQMLVASNVLGPPLFEGRYNIGYWAWELERFPEVWRGAIDLVDELWAPSTFIRDALVQMTDKPVIHMPLRVEPPQAVDLDWETLRLPTAAFSFLFFFDFNSYVTRKNPTAVIEAFQRAFPRESNSEVVLIIKTIGAEQHASAAERLARTCAADTRIACIHDTLPADQMAGLVAYADCFVSLHRSEGFGRGLAEAMAQGRIVIGTNYGGNTDFMSHDNSYLVDYDMVPVGANNYVHGEGARWAEPDIDHAATLMRRVCDSPTEARQRAALGQRMIVENHSASAVATNIVRRLTEIGLLDHPKVPLLARYRAA